MMGIVLIVDLDEVFEKQLPDLNAQFCTVGSVILYFLNRVLVD
jgi:hypothetical protein